jgi:putative glycosyltransferase (TIGR04372 family)
MGSVVQERLEFADEKYVFDYETNGIRPEFLDVYRASVCTLCVSVLTGYHALPTLFRKPTLYTNMVLIGMFPSF